MTDMRSECAGKFAGHEERIRDCEDYQKKNNGAIVSLNQKYDKIVFLLVATLASTTASLVLLLLRVR
jgi:hypothetical protein